ncbi:hypothetical protein GW17_00011647, partial [Ensete ventricosum]
WLHFANAFIDRVYDAGRLVQSQHEKILTLRATNKVLKEGVGQELVVAAERRGLDGARNDGVRLLGDVLSLIEAIVFFEAELKAKGPKVVAAYKASRGFESGLEKMERVKYEFRYRMTLKQLRGKHPEITIERDPFPECFEDANVEMDLD